MVPQRLSEFWGKSIQLLTDNSSLPLIIASHDTCVTSSESGRTLLDVCFTSSEFVACYTTVSSEYIYMLNFKLSSKRQMCAKIVSTRSRLLLILVRSNHIARSAQSFKHSAATVSIASVKIIANQFLFLCLLTINTTINVKLSSLKKEKAFSNYFNGCNGNCYCTMFEDMSTSGCVSPLD